jgi:thiamine kinase-like enzyme
LSDPVYEHLGGAEPVGPPELRQLLHELFGRPGADVRWAGRQVLKPEVYRLPPPSGNGERAIVVKRLDSGRARRNQFVAERWLPAVGLSGRAASLLGSAAELSGTGVWHVYEDLGNGVLETKNPDPARIEAVVELIAQVHTRFAGHRLLAECRLYGDDFGAGFFGANLRDAIRSLEALQPPAIDMAPKDAAVRDRLLRRLRELLDQEPSRARALAEFGGPETLLHGDLWATNALIVAGRDGPQARLIDWDHVGVGPISYDLSTLLARFPVPDRAWILELYRRALGRGLQTAPQRGWRLPTVQVLNALFDTAEHARLANRVIWPALAVLDGQAAWGFEELARVEQWFEEWEPVIPC